MEIYIFVRLVFTSLSGNQAYGLGYDTVGNGINLTHVNIRLESGTQGVETRVYLSSPVLTTI